jgi:hypothetical protein
MRHEQLPRVMREEGHKLFDPISSEIRSAGRINFQVSRTLLSLPFDILAFMASRCSFKSRFSIPLGKTRRCRLSNPRRHGSASRCRTRLPIENVLFCDLRLFSEIQKT